MEANARSEITGLSGADRRRIKAAQMQASDQISILEQGKATNGSDFYSYRYLATEGFLPGYNFPRLPLYAFIPGEGKTGSFLQRARFLAISEFGPRSLIYHEGRAYRVMKAKLPPEVRTGDGAELATRDIFICSNCGACHDGEVAHEVAVALLDDVAKMNADAELDAAFSWHTGVALDHAVLHFEGETYRVDHAAELDEAAVSGAFDDAPAMRVDGGINQIAAQSAKPRQRAILIRSREPAVANDIRD
jgi:hypothetical protein